jgi:hypothetical protein
MSATEQLSDFDPSLDPSLDYDIPDMSVDFQESTWNQFEYEWMALMSSNISDHNICWDIQPNENLHTESHLRPQPIASRPASPRIASENPFEDMVYLAPESSQITSLSASNDSYSKDSSFASGSPQQNYLSPPDTMSSTSPSPPLKAIYACDTCARKFEKKNVLKFVYHLLHKLNPPSIVPNF